MNFSGLGSVIMNKDYLKKFLKNLGLLVALLVLLLIFFPTLMADAYHALGQIFGPLVILMVIVAALPKKKSN